MSSSASGSASSSSSKTSHFNCPICLEIMREPFMTKCGHSFCYACLMDYFKVKKDCPICRHPLDRDQVFPNFSLDLAIVNSKTVDHANHAHAVMASFMSASANSDLVFSNSSTHNASLKRLCQTVVPNTVCVDIPTLDTFMNSIVAKRQKLEAQESQIRNELVLDFLQKTRALKQESWDKTSREISILDQDIERIKSKMPAKSSPEHQKGFADEVISSAQVPIGPPDSAGDGGSSRKRPLSDLDCVVAEEAPQNTSVMDVDANESFSYNTEHGLFDPAATKLKSLNSRKKRVYAHFDDLQSCYFELRDAERCRTSCSSSALTLTAAVAPISLAQSLDEFSRQLSSCSKYHELKPIASLKYGDLYPSSSIVSSVELDADEKLIAMAGVTKRIKIFDYDQVVGDPVEIHYPVREMSGNSKISCLSWNSYIKNHLVSSDYEGLVTLWDSATGQHLHIFEEHERRTWSVDFSRTDPMRLASGSDDSKVKLWSTNTPHSVATIDNKANICCVKFNPEISHLLAFGSADHLVHYYDLRKIKDPISIFRGHRKAVSYVKFLGKDEIISASTDSTLKSWKTGGDPDVPSRTYSGHVNEKNFVGLAVHQSGLHGTDFIACGSETNSVHLYVRSLGKPILLYKFRSSQLPLASAAALSIRTSPSSVLSGGGRGPVLPGLHAYGSGMSHFADQASFVSPSRQPQLQSQTALALPSHHLAGHFQSEDIMLGSSHRFTQPGSSLGSLLSTDESAEEEGPHFVSSVCWNRRQNTLLAANSQGIIKVLQLVGYP